MIKRSVSDPAGAGTWADVLPLQELMRGGEILPQAFYSRPALEVARELLGTVLVHGETAGRIVEVEAYLGPHDLAAHAAAGVTARTKVLFGPPGHAYIYLIYGIHECLNFVAEPDGVAGCVLIRALEPLSGVAVMQRRRGRTKRRQDLCSGPGKLTAALGITRKLNGTSVTGRGPLKVLRTAGKERFEIAEGPRIGITKCADWPLRFWIARNPFVSRL